MDKIEPTQDSILSVEKIIDLIRSVRNELIKEFLNDDYLADYYKDHFEKDLSNLKKEFLKRDLKELLIAPVDLVHYAGLITQIKDSGSASLMEKNTDYFYREMHQIFGKYGS